MTRRLIIPSRSCFDDSDDISSIKILFHMHANCNAVICSLHEVSITFIAWWLLRRHRLKGNRLPCAGVLKWGIHASGHLILLFWYRHYSLNMSKTACGRRRIYDNGQYREEIIIKANIARAGNFIARHTGPFVTIKLSAMPSANNQCHVSKWYAILSAAISWAGKHPSPLYAISRKADHLVHDTVLGV